MASEPAHMAHRQLLYEFGARGEQHRRRLGHRLELVIAADLLDEGDGHPGLEVSWVPVGERTAVDEALGHEASSSSALVWARTMSSSPQQTSRSASAKPAAAAG